MPLVQSKFSPLLLFRNGHFSTIYSAKLRPLPKLLQERERLTLEDGDFIDVDWSYGLQPSSKVAILLHGLEGNAQRIYIKAQAKHLVDNGWNVAAMNHRGCSGEENVLYESYNSGRTYDLKALIEFILKKNQYDTISIIGFSLGGNLLLKYLGEEDHLPKEIKKGIAISSPLHLKGSLEALLKRENWIYHTSFLLDLRKKYKRKMKLFPDKMNAAELSKIKTLLDFDHLYTAPAHGFKDAWEYYEKSSSLQFLDKIKIPTLILNAENDSFLSPLCYPFALAESSKNIYLESPKHGGHVGFHMSNALYYTEHRAIQFLNEL